MKFLIFFFQYESVVEYICRNYTCLLKDGYFCDIIPTIFTFSIILAWKKLSLGILMRAKSWQGQRVQRSDLMVSINT